MMQINKEAIKEYAKGYDERQRREKTYDENIENEIKEWLRTRNYLDKERFIRLALWKSKRPKKHYYNNDDLTIREITQFSLTTKSEPARIKSLLVLNGVSYPVASAVLHFAFPDEYPILDFRVVWSLGIQQPKSYDFDFWQKYCENIRGISKETGENIRAVDKALWEYSKKHQKKP